MEVCDRHSINQLCNNDADCVARTVTVTSGTLGTVRNLTTAACEFKAMQQDGKAYQRGSAVCIGFPHTMFTAFDGVNMGTGFQPTQGACAGGVPGSCCLCNPIAFNGDTVKAKLTCDDFTAPPPV